MGPLVWVGSPCLGSKSPYEPYRGGFKGSTHSAAIRGPGLGQYRRTPRFLKRGGHYSKIVCLDVCGSIHCMRIMAYTYIRGCDAGANFSTALVHHEFRHPPLKAQNCFVQLGVSKNEGPDIDPT